MNVQVPGRDLQVALRASFLRLWTAQVRRGKHGEGGAEVGDIWQLM